ncbi:hypothetical protein [Streptomyces cinerochromogenes]|uniref:hypothetical protein n=1 Tax=Streptomyces cinerochromogenes TaxID=66422 RepID=UPI0016709137|nr:hypothetical protein [Streptomyces cinerochromogenes]GGS57895.1 hypothetical protein GCM10010206_19590 [Streptomyces cinerochromogenes]
MNSVPRSLPISGLDDMSNESRMIATPWSRMLRGIGLGQYPIDYDPAIAGHLRDTFDQLAKKVSPSDGYTLFCREMTDFTLRAVEPGRDRAWIEPAVGPLLEAVRSVANPYYRAMAGSILLDAFAKLGLDLSLLVNDERDVPAEVLGMLDEIAPDAIPDENQGRHGEYERVSASASVFLALGQLGLQDRLVTAERNHVVEALNLLDRIPIPYFCGRAGGMLMSVIALIGHTEHIFDGERDYMQEVLAYLTRADEVGNWPAFPNPMPKPWLKVYPLLTMLNAVAMCGRAEYLTRPIDALAEARDLMGQIPWTTRVHMAQYYVIALHNLGRLADELPDLDTFMKDVTAVLDIVDPGENFSPRGNAYPYIIELSMMTGRMDLIPDEALVRMADSFPDLDRTGEWTNAIDDNRANRAFPVSYVLNVLGEIGAAEQLMFTPRDRYEGRSAIAWMVENISEGAREEGDRISMLDHALVSYALRMRGADTEETELFKNFEFPFSK